MVWNSVGGRSAGMSLEIASFFALLTHITANTSPFEGRSAIVSFALPVSESKMKASQPFLIGALLRQNRSDQATISEVKWKLSSLSS